MRVLLLLRGSPGCGKSTWIEQNGLKQYTLSSDDIRMLCSSPVLNISGKEEISQNNDAIVWSTLFKILEIRMENGEFTVIDATNSKTSEMNRYKDMCESYKYRIYCVDFTSIPIDVVKERNRNRTEYKRVDDEVIDKMYSRFQTQAIPSGITVIQPNELDKVWMKPINLDKYKRIHVIGDIHGCNTALQEYITASNGICDDEFYIFCGDYIDRGIENVKVLEFLISIYQKQNVMLLEGNHERNLWIWANDGISKSKEFELVMKTQLEKEHVDKKDIRRVFRKLGQCAYFNYGKNTYIVTHAGISTIPQNLTKVSTSQMIRGVGSYNSFQEVADSFARNTPSNCYQIHGHRNTKHAPVQINDRVFNLEGDVEFGGNLRCVQIYPDGQHIPVEIKNNVYKPPEEITANNSSLDKKSIGDVIIQLRQNRFIQEKMYGDISSFNFTKTAFYDKVWDEQTTKARGLYINIPKQKVVARAYDKFFNINERPETKFDFLHHKLSFPVTAYVKENGFLGILSYNDTDDSVFITTKSSPDGDYSAWLKEIIFRKVSANTLEDIKEYCKVNNVSFVFECIDMTNDPHIIEYPENKLFLLDIVYNDITYRKYSFERLCSVADKFGLVHKERAFRIESWQEFFDWYYTVTDDDYLYNGRNIEGFVVEDANGYMVKLKLKYYNFWKFMRAISHETIRKGYIDKTSALTTPLANQYYGWVKTLRGSTEDLDSIPKDICTLRTLFFKTDAGRLFKGDTV